MKNIKKNFNYSKKHQWKIVISLMIFNYINKYKDEFPENLKWNELLYIISKMEYKIFSRKFKSLLGDFIAFPSEELKSYKNDYKKYLEFLLNIKILKKLNYSTTKKRCTKYTFDYEKAFSLGYRTFDIKNIEIEKSIKQSKNVCLFKGYKNKDIEHLTKWFNNGLQFDNNNFLEQAPSILTKKERSYNVYNHRSFNRLLSKVQSYYRSAEELINKDYRMSRNKNSDNRLHTNLTNLSKKLRQFINYKGETLCSWDIKNSQPFFLAVLIEGLINNNNKVIKNINKVFGNNNNGIISEISSTFLSDKGFQKEFEIFKKWVLEGSFYHEVMDIYNLQKDDDDKYNVNVYNADTNKTFKKDFKCAREASKALTLRLLYTPSKRKDEHYNTFKSRFPKFCDFISFLKNYSAGEDSHKKFSKLLQHIEADCIIDNITKKIAKKHPSAPIYTIHDSIITTETYIEEFQELIYNYISEYTNGLTPQLSKECWCLEVNSNFSLEAA